MADATHGSGAPEAAPTSPPLVAAAWPKEHERPAADATPIEHARFYARRLGWIVRPTAGECDRWTYARKLEREAFEDLRERYRREPTEDERVAIWDDARDIADKASKGPIGFIRCPANADECDEAYLGRCWGGRNGHERGICIMPGVSSRGFPVVLVDVDVGHDDAPPGDLSGPWGAGLPGPKSRTPRGGMHTLVLSLGGERSSGGRTGLAQGVDVIGCGGTPINVPAGSATPGRVWTSWAPPVVAPEALRRPPTWRAAGSTGATGDDGAAERAGAWMGPGASEGGSGRAADALRTMHAKGSRGRACGTIVGMLARRGRLPDDVVAAALEVLVEDAAARDQPEERTRAEQARWHRLLTCPTKDEPRDRNFACDVIEAWSCVRDAEGGRRRWSYREARMQARSHWDTASRRQEGEVGTEDHATAADGVGAERAGVSVGGRAGVERGELDGLHQHDDRPVRLRAGGDAPQGDGEAQFGLTVGGDARNPHTNGAALTFNAERDVSGAELKATIITEIDTKDFHAGNVIPPAPPAPPAPPPPAPQADVVATAPAKDMAAKITEGTLRRLLPTLGDSYTREHRLRDYARRPLSVDVLYPFADFRTGQLEADPGPGHGMGRAFSRAIGGISAGSAKVFGAPSGKAGKSHFLGQMIEGLALCTAARILGDPMWANAPIVLPVWISEMPIPGEPWLRMIGRHCGFDLLAIRDGELAEDGPGVAYMANELQWSSHDVVKRARFLCDFYDDHRDVTALGFALKYLVREINIDVLPRAKGTGSFREDPQAGPALMDSVAGSIAIFRRDLASLLAVPEDKITPVVLLDPCQHYASDGPSQKSAIDSLIRAAHSRICGSGLGLEGVLLATSDTTKAATKEMPLDVFLSEDGKRLAADVFAGSAGIVHRFDTAVAMSSVEPPPGVLRTTQYVRVLLGRSGSPAEVYPYDWEKHTGRYRARPSEPLRPPVDPADRPRQGGGGGGSSADRGRQRAPSGPGVGDEPGPRRYGTPPKRVYGRTDD